MGRIDSERPPVRKTVAPRSAYPTLEEFTEYYRFIATYQPHHDGPKLVAINPSTGSQYEAYVGAEKLYEVESNLTRRRHNILDKPVTITGIEQFAWILFCKLKQKRDLILK